LENKRSGSEDSRKSYCHALFSFCRFANKTPDDLVQMKKRQLEILLEEFGYYKRRKRNHREGNCPNTINTVMRNLKTFFHCNGFRNEQELYVEFHRVIGRARTRKEYVPTPEEAWRVAECTGSLRDKAIILVLFTAGLRNGTLRAILYGDVREELERVEGPVLIKVYPEMKKLVPTACKNNIEYATFIPKDAIAVLKLYIAQRFAKVGKIEDNEPLFASEYNQLPRTNRVKSTISERQLQIIIKEAAKRAGLKEWRKVTPHCFRKTYETLLRSRLRDGSRLDMQTIIYLMGHRQPGSQEPYFDRSKIEHMRNQYSRLKFGRAAVENKFKVLKAAVARAFEETGIDPEQVILDYVKMKQDSTEPSMGDNWQSDALKGGGTEFGV